MKSKKIIASVLSLAIVIGMMPTFVGATVVEGGEDQDPAVQEEQVEAGSDEADGTAKTHTATVLDGCETRIIQNCCYRKDIRSVFD